MNMDRVFDALADWNLWGNYKADIKDREVIPSLDPIDVVLCLMGVRRSGKSSLAYLLMSRGNLNESLMINFEDPRLSDLEAEDIIKIVELYERKVNTKLSLLVLDEVQNIAGWERVARLYEEAKRVKVIVTGSSSKLMGEEYASVLTGRHMDFEVFPLSFREFLSWRNIKFEGMELYKNRVKILSAFDEYLKYGGFPEINFLKGDRVKTTLLAQYFEDIIMKDIIKRYRVREIEKIENLARLYLSNIGTLQSYNRLKSVVNLSLDSVERFSRYFETARLFFFVPKFSYSLKQQILNPKKVYVVDVGLSNAMGTKFSQNIGHIMENVVAVELFRRHAYWSRRMEVYYWKDHQQREVDFVVKEGEKVKELIQVTYASGKDEIDRRELRALEKASEELRCRNKTVITWDYEEDGKIKFIPLWKWLLQY